VDVAALEDLLPEADDVKGNVSVSSSSLLLSLLREERRLTGDIFPVSGDRCSTEV